jgi:glycosyltransferase involved in cell wall biosynthesis
VNPVADAGAESAGSVAVVDRPLRIAHVIGGLNVGGAERHVVNLMNAFSGQTRDLILIGHQGAGTGLRPALDEGVSVHELLIRRRDLPVGVRRLARLFRTLRCDVVQSHMFWSNLCVSLAAPLAGVQVLITTEHGENRWKRPRHRWLERAVISRLADLRFCVSREIMRRRLEIDRVPADKLMLIPNGTQVPADPIECIRREILTIGTVGRIVPEKDHANLIAAVRLLRDLGYRFRVCVIGDGPDLAAVRRRAAESGVGELFEFPGMVSDVEACYRRFDVFVLSSRQEGQPVALLEAMAIGLPCVATDVGAISLTLESGAEGTVVEPQRPEALADGLRPYLDSLELRARHGRAARARIEREFAIGAIAERHLRIYRDMLARQAPATG